MVGRFHREGEVGGGGGGSAGGEEDNGGFGDVLGGEVEEEFEQVAGVGLDGADLVVADEVRENALHDRAIF